jgi:hypothetical protein
MNLQTELSTFPASLVKGHRVPQGIKASSETGEGRISLKDVRVVARCLILGCTFVKSGRKFGHADCRLKGEGYYENLDIRTRSQMASCIY